MKGTMRMEREKVSTDEVQLRRTVEVTNTVYIVE
jgi:hypothetical protein